MRISLDRRKQVSYLSYMRVITLREFAALGGKAVAAKRTPAERTAIARRAVETRWAKHRAAKAAQKEGDK